MVLAAPLTNAGGVIADIWDPVGRGPALSVYVGCVFMGPSFGPVFGGFVTVTIGWRWHFWLLLIAFVPIYLGEQGSALKLTLDSLDLQRRRLLGPHGDLLARDVLSVSDVHPHA